MGKIALGHLERERKEHRERNARLARERLDDPYYARGVQRQRNRAAIDDIRATRARDARPFSPVMTAARQRYRMPLQGIGTAYLED